MLRPLLFSCLLWAPLVSACTSTRAVRKSQLTQSLCCPSQTRTPILNTDFLSDGITESIISSLSQLSQLKVMARSTVFQYKGKDVDPRKVGHDLGVRVVLMGRLIQQGDNLTIRTELVNVSDGTELWGQQYNRKLADDKPEGTSEQVSGYASVGSCFFPPSPSGRRAREEGRS